MPWLPKILLAEPFWARHRGPFTLCISRPSAKKGKTGFYTTEWLQGSSEGPDAQDEAYALLTDPRDTITVVSVWSEREQSYSMNYRKGDIKCGS
jgi:hypothetical protein